MRCVLNALIQNVRVSPIRDGDFINLASVLALLLVRVLADHPPAC